MLTDKILKKQFLNQCINFIWTFLCFTPIVFFWIFAGPGIWFYIFLIISFAAGFLPSNFFGLSSSPEYYEKLGVRWIRKFVQNGDFVNRLLKNEKKIGKTIKNKSHAKKYLKTVSMYEKYHIICFIFFCLSGSFAIVKQEFMYFILIMASNILYNICPIILQQYNRTRILGLRN